MTQKLPKFILAFALLGFVAGTTELLALDKMQPEGFSFSCVPRKPMETKPGHPPRFGGLGTISVDAILITPADMEIKLKRPSIKKRPSEKNSSLNPDGNVLVSVYSESGKNEELERRISVYGSSGRYFENNGKKFHRQMELFRIKVPVSHAVWEKEIDQKLDKEVPRMAKYLKDRAEKENWSKEDLDKELKKNSREYKKKNLLKAIRPNRTGKFEIRCEYSENSEGFWKGNLKAKPLLVEVVGMEEQVKDFYKKNPEVMKKLRENIRKQIEKQKAGNSQNKK